MSLFLHVLKPFSESKMEVEWARIDTPNGSFLIGPGHRPLVNIVKPKSVITYKSQGQEVTLEAPENGGLVHVHEDKIILFLE